MPGCPDTKNYIFDQKKTPAGTFTRKTKVVNTKNIIFHQKKAPAGTLTRKTKVVNTKNHIFQQEIMTRAVNLQCRLICRDQSTLKLQSAVIEGIVDMDAVVHDTRCRWRLYFSIFRGIFSLYRAYIGPF